MDPVGPARRINAKDGGARSQADWPSCIYFPLPAPRAAPSVGVGLCVHGNMKYSRISSGYGRGWSGGVRRLFNLGMHTLQAVGGAVLTRTWCGMSFRLR